VVEEEQLDISRLGFLDIVLVLNGRTERQWHNDYRFLEALIPVYPRGLSLSYLWRIYQQEVSSMKRYTIGATYEQLFFQPALSFYDWGYADFMIFDPDGCFFARKAIVDDVWRNADESKGQFLDPAFQVPLVSEAFVVASRYAQALGYGSDTNLYFWIRWSGLKGRRLENRRQVFMDYQLADQCRDNHVQLDVSLPINPSKEEIVQKTTEAIQRLGRAFGGYLYPAQVVQGQLTQVLNQL
jgi:hypothetical protein